MTIFAETGGTGPAAVPDRAPELFQNRTEIIRRFASLLNDDPPPRRLLFLQGMGGNGKSLMLRYLETRCCLRLRPEDWQQIRDLPGEDLAAAIGAAEHAERVPVSAASPCFAKVDGRSDTRRRQGEKSSSKRTRSMHVRAVIVQNSKAPTEVSVSIMLATITRDRRRQRPGARRR